MHLVWSVQVEDATLCVILEQLTIFISFWPDASNSRPCSSDALALFSHVDSDGFLAIFSATVSRHFMIRSLERRLKQLEADMKRGEEKAAVKAGYNFCTRPSVRKYFKTNNFSNYGTTSCYMAWMDIIGLDVIKKYSFNMFSYLWWSMKI